MTTTTIHCDRCKLKVETVYAVRFQAVDIEGDALDDFSIKEMCPTCIDLCKSFIKDTAHIMSAD